MAPHTQLARLSEVETNVQKLTVEVAVLRESHDRLTSEFHAFKDEMKKELKETNQTVSGVRMTIAQWSVGVAIIIGVGATVGGWFIKTSLDGLRATMNVRLP